MKRGAHLLKEAVAVIGVIYLAILALLLFAQFVLPPEYGDLTRSVFSILLFVAVVLLPLCLLVRRRRVALLMVVPLIGLALLYGPLLLPRNPSAPAAVPQITLLTFNLQATTDSLDSLVSTILTADADIVGVQELSFEAAERFNRDLTIQYPYRALYPQENAHVGQGVMSRYPVNAEEFWRNQHLEATLGHMRVQLDVNGSAIVLYNTHPIPAFSFEQGLNLQPHSDEITILLERATAETAPVILVGDFNMTDQFNEYHAVTAQYTDTFREAGQSGFGFTFPAGNRLPLPPLIRIDYVFHDESFQGLEARVWARSGSSDHLPLFARLALLLPEP